MPNLLYFVLGYLVCGVKLFTQVSRWTGAGVNWSKDFWGLKDPRLDYILRNIQNEPSRFFHHVTDYVVEWTELNPQRAAKTFAGIWLITLILSNV